MPTAEFRREITARADPSEAWAILTDVTRVAPWVTIVSEAQELAPMEHYTAVLADRLGPFRLKARLDIKVPESEPGRRIRVVAAGEDRQVHSRIAVDATLDLLPHKQGTKVIVEGRYEVAGRAASMGAGIIAQKAQKILDEFFTRAATELG